jgi:hypothetical protein
VVRMGVRRSRHWQDWSWCVFLHVPLRIEAVSWSFSVLYQAVNEDHHKLPKAYPQTLPVFDQTHRQVHDQRNRSPASSKCYTSTSSTPQGPIKPRSSFTKKQSHHLKDTDLIVPNSYTTTSAAPGSWPQVPLLSRHVPSKQLRLGPIRAHKQFIPR